MPKKTKESKRLYRRLRASGVRKKTARRASALAIAGRDPSRREREKVERLAAASEELLALIRHREEPPAEHRSTDDGHAIEVDRASSIRVSS